MTRRAKFLKLIGRDLREPVSSQVEGSVSLAELGTGVSARVVRVDGDKTTERRMEAFGIVPGAVIRKRSEIPAHGPIVVEKGQIQLAMSHDMGSSIIVEPAERQQ